MIHAVYDITGCAIPDPKPAELINAMRDTVRRLGCTVLGELPVLFQPHGVTCVLVLGESHLTVSTWPEHHLAHIDLFTCRADTDPEYAIAPIITTLSAETVHGQRIHRIGPHSLEPATQRQSAMSVTRSAPAPTTSQQPAPGTLRRPADQREPAGL